MRPFILFSAVIFAGFVPVSASAQSPALNTNNSPVEITADKAIEWHRNDKRFIARGNVLAVQSPIEIRSETLTADYQESQKSGMDITKLTANENVRIQDATNTVTGDNAFYDLDKGYAEVTGQNLKMTTPEQVITANDRMEYWSVKGEAAAIGNAKVVRGDDTIMADSIRAFFSEQASNSSQESKIRRLEANGNVVIITPEERITGESGFYEASTEIAELHGNVRIERGPNILEGQKAEVNLKTNVSKIFGGNQGSERVRGVFFPDSQSN